MKCYWLSMCFVIIFFRYYEDLAYNVTTELYCIDKDEARKLLVTEMKRYNSITILGIAEKFTLMKFMGHAAGQKMLNKIWMGGISSNTSNLKVNIIWKQTFELIQNELLSKVWNNETQYATNVLLLKYTLYQWSICVIAFIFDDLVYVFIT